MDSEFSDRLERKCDGENMACHFVQPIATTTTAEQKKSSHYITHKQNKLLLKS